MAQIDSITMHPTDNYVSYNDSDSMTDYHHGYSLPMKRAAQWLKEDGAGVVYVRPVNMDTDTKYAKRVAQIAKMAGYTVKDVSEDREYESAHGGMIRRRCPQWHLMRAE